MTVLEVIQRSAQFLAGKGVDCPRLQAELLLAHVLGLARMQLYLNFERVLTPAETEALRQLVKRRGGREPLQQITGCACFCGFDIAVNRHVLVPRPETELLAERGWRFLRELAARGQGRPEAAPAALDFGTGSGCVAIALAANCPEASVMAWTCPPPRWTWPGKTRRGTAWPNVCASSTETGWASCRRTFAYTWWSATRPTSPAAR